jgi:hypothetical protein
MMFSRSSRLIRAVAAAILPGLTILLLASLNAATHLAAAPSVEPVDSGIRASRPYTEPTGTATPNLIETAVAATLTALAPSPSATPTRTPKPTPLATVQPRPAYLPTLLRDPGCKPTVGNMDVVFVLDGSKYMHVGSTHGTSWDTGLWMIRTMLGLMDWTPDAKGGQDQAGVVVYRHSRTVNPAEQLALTPNGKAVSDFLDKLQFGTPAETNRPDLALLWAADMVGDYHHKPDNIRVIVFISEMQAKNVPWENVPGCEDPKGMKENCTVLKRAEDVKNGGNAIALFATSYGNRGYELKAMASDPALALLLPEQPQIAAAYQLLLQPTVKPCPPETYWPYR